MRKPRLFIASSVESLGIAEAVNVNLDHDLEVTIWKGGTFKLSSSAIDDLVAKSSTVDFALFIFTPDDVIKIRDRNQHVVRDNVIFEMGLFVGAIGKERSFILKPRDVEMHLPSDLLGVTPADYDSNRSDFDLVSATSRACSLIKSEVARLGTVNRASLSESIRLVANPQKYELIEMDYRVLSACLDSYTDSPQGIRFYDLDRKIKCVNEAQVKLSIIKLGRMGLLSKTVQQYDDQYGTEYFTYSITELGVDFLLKQQNELGVILTDEAVF